MSFDNDAQPALEEKKSPLRFMRLRDTQKAWQGASRHAARVLFLRWILPGLALALLATLVIWPLWNQRDYASVAVDALPNLVVENLRLSGVDDANEPFAVTARRALRVKDTPNTFDLERPQGELSLSDGAFITGLANFGRYDEAQKKLWLGGDVAFFHDEGTQFLTSEAQLDLKQNIAWGEKPVIIQGDFGRIEGTGFQMLDGGSTLIVKGSPKAFLNLPPPASSDRKEP